MLTYLQENQGKPSQDTSSIQVFYCLGLLWAIMNNSLLRIPSNYRFLSECLTGRKCENKPAADISELSEMYGPQCEIQLKHTQQNYFCQLTLTNKQKFTGRVFFCSSEDPAGSNQKDVMVNQIQILLYAQDLLPSAGKLNKFAVILQLDFTFKIK